MKKFIAMVLALGMTVGTFSACGSSSSDDGDNKKESASSLSDEELKSLLLENNKTAKSLYTSINDGCADLIIEESAVCQSGTYRFTLSEAEKAAKEEMDFALDSNTDTVDIDSDLKIISEDETYYLLEKSCWNVLKDSDNKNGIVVVTISDENPVSVCYSDSKLGVCSGAFPYPKTSAPSFNIDKIPDEYLTGDFDEDEYDDDM